MTATNNASSPSNLWNPNGSDGVHHCVTGVTTAYTVTVTDGGTGCVGGNGETVTVLPSTNNSSQNQPPVKAPVK